MLPFEFYEYYYYLKMSDFLLYILVLFNLEENTFICYIQCFTLLNVCMYVTDINFFIPADEHK